MKLWHFKWKLASKLKIIVLFCCYDPLLEGNCTPWNITFEQNFHISIFRKPQSICPGNIWGSDAIKVVQVDHFLKNAKKHAILGHLQKFTESNKSFSHHVPPLPKPRTKIFLNHCDAIHTSREEIFWFPPCRETTTLDRCVVETD